MLLILVAIIAMLVGWHVVDSVLWGRERRELCSRIQAGTLADYERGRVVERELSRRPIQSMEAVPEVEDLTGLRDELPEEVLVEAQSGFNALMRTGN